MQSNFEPYVDSLRLLTYPQMGLGLWEKALEKLQIEKSWVVEVLYFLPEIIR